MLRTLINKPERDGAGRIDEGELTHRVVAAYAAQEGQGGHEAASKVRPAREALWALVLEHMPAELADMLRRWAETAHPSNRGGVGALRMAVADWVRRRACCEVCLLPMAEGRRCGAGVCKERPWGGIRLPETMHAGIKLARAELSRAPLAILVDRDFKLLSALTTGPTVPAVVADARVDVERALQHAILANGRLILKVQLQFYAAHGGITRADLIQGGALGCRRALLDYDPGVAKFSAYAIQWIRRGLLDVFMVRDLVPHPEELATRRRRLEYLGLDGSALLSGMQDAERGIFQGLMEALEPVLVGEPILHEIHLSRVVMGAKGLTEERRLLKVAAWAAKRIDEGHARKMLRNGPQQVKTGGRRKSGQKRAAMGGAALLAALRHGGTRVVPMVPEADDDIPRGLSMVDPSCGFQGGPSDHPVLVADDMEARSIQLDWEAKQHAQFLRALEGLRMELPEAAEVIRRQHGLDSVGTETLDSIAREPLRCSGRKVSRETLRNLGELGMAKLRLYLGSVPDMPPAVREPYPVIVRSEYVPSLSGVTVSPSEMASWSEGREIMDAISW